VNDNVIALAPAAKMADPMVIEKLEQALAMARTGDLVTVAIAGQTSDGGVLTGYATEGGSVFVMLGALTSLVQRFGSEAIE